MKRIYSIGFTVSAVFILSSVLFSQEGRKIELNAQGILAQVDRVFKYPRGLVRGMMKHIRPDGGDTTITFTGFISWEDSLFTFSSRERGDQLKVLYNMGGEDIWVYNIHALKLFHKLGVDKYDDILSTNFSYIDLSNADFQSSYNAVIKGVAFIKGIEAYRLELTPISKEGIYGMLAIYVTKDKYVPLRIDFHDRDKAIFKFMTIVKIKESDRRIIPLRYDMMNIRQGTVTIVNFSEFDESAVYGKEVFRSEKLGEQQ
jgi:hypothetical protein